MSESGIDQCMLCFALLCWHCIALLFLALSRCCYGAEKTTEKDSEKEEEEEERDNQIGVPPLVFGTIVREQGGREKGSDSSKVDDSWILSH